MKAGGRLVVYVTSHGFGHLNRSVAVINLVPADVPVTIRSDPSLFDHWGERLRRPAELEAHVSDSGAVNPPGDSASTDGPATLERAARVHAMALESLDVEVERLRTGGVAAVLSDVPPLPLVAARRAGVPGFALANFTWAEIYAPHARRLGGDALRLVADLRAAYRQAEAVFRASPGLKMNEFRRSIDVGMVVTPGRDRRAELRATLGLGKAERLVYFYIGRYGQTDLGWERLERLGREGVHFVGFHPAPTGPMANLHVIPAAEWTGADLAASADAIVAKAGYGTACEAMVAGTPMLYPHRTGFVEHRALDRALRDWGGGIPLPARDFRELRLERHLARAFSLKPGPPPFPADGARTIADHLAALCRGKARAASA
ncbi:MAG: hypothetical protein U0835_01905 [Isosphaeraceae bacterium]